jgi:hypothetical protein
MCCGQPEKTNHSERTLTQNGSFCQVCAVDLTLIVVNINIVCLVYCRKGPLIFDLAVTTHLASGQPLTWFHDGSETLPNYETWANDVADCILQEDKEGLTKQMQKLAKRLEDVQPDVNPKSQDTSKCGSTFVFGSNTSWHGGVGPLSTGKFRFVIYCQAVPAFLAGRMEDSSYSEFLASRYTAELVLDRESMLDPEMLVSLLKIQHKKKYCTKLTTETIARQFIFGGVIRGESC